MLTSVESEKLCIGHGLEETGRTNGEEDTKFEDVTC